MRAHCTRLIAVIAGVLASLVIGAGPVSAAAEHLTFVEDWSGSTRFAAGEGPCVSYAGTLFEDRHLVAKGVTPSGQSRSTGDSRELIVVAMVDADFTLTPSRSADGPTYTGTYREQSGGRFLVTEQGDDPIVARYAVHATAVGSDGSVLKFVLSGRITVRADGTVTTAHDGLHCIRS